MGSIQETFGKSAIPVQLPLGDGPQFRGVVDLLSQKCFVFSDDEKGTCREEPIPAEMSDEVASALEALTEKVAECDEQLMETYLDKGALSVEDLRNGMRKALREREIFPILATDALANMGIQPLLDFVVAYAPSILERASVPTEPETVAPREDAPPMAMVFKTISDPFSGKISIMKVFTGVVKNDTTLQNINKESDERVGHLFGLQGKTQDAVEAEVHAGDIVAVAKLKETQTGDTLAAKGTKNRFKPFKFPIPSISYAIEPKSRNDEGKISTALQRISEEDPTLHMTRDPQTKELVISGNGEIHVKMIVNKLKKKYGVDVDMKPPKIPYLETITGHADINKKYKKQSGGRGQYGHVMIKMDPIPRGEDFIFEETIFGGSVPKNYIPAVEKGVLEARERGVLAGYRLVDFKVNLYDGSYHDVDSSEMAFKIAASMAFKMAAKAAKPVLLEPIMSVEVVIPSEFMGDISGTISGRRGRIQGMEQKGKNQVVRALVPMSEMLDFNPVLTSITGGRGDYAMEFAHYDPLPTHLQQKVIDEAIREGRIREEEED